MTLHDQLKALAKRVECSPFNTPQHDKASFQLETLVIHNLPAILAALKDAERMNWLENADKCYWASIQSQPHGETVYLGQGENVRAAIDAAIGSKQT